MFVRGSEQSIQSKAGHLHGAGGVAAAPLEQHEAAHQRQAAANVRADKSVRSACISAADVRVSAQRCRLMACCCERADTHALS
jgi:hypothetical protein